MFNPFAGLVTAFSGSSRYGDRTSSLERSNVCRMSPRNRFGAGRVPTVCSALLGVLTLFSCALVAQNSTDSGPVANVDPFIGTGGGPGGTINLFPGPTMPFGMVQLSPDTEDKGFGYHYDQLSIQGFSMTHMSGVGCPNEGDVFFAPTTGPVGTRVADFESPYSHSDETASPGYYRVHLGRWDTDVELSATDRTGIVRFTFPAGQPANVLAPISHTLNHTMAASVRVVGDREIQG
jgi:putative alpha-1,2-mannosidase